MRFPVHLEDVDLFGEGTQEHRKRFMASCIANLRCCVCPVAVASSDVPTVEVTAG